MRFFMQYHHINEEDASGLIHEQFPSWLKEYVNDERNGTPCPYVKALVLSLDPKATSWHIYFVNGNEGHFWLVIHLLQVILGLSNTAYSFHWLLYSSGIPTDCTSLGISITFPTHF
ncbi:unnamed protein product [Vicia faba]|uniref:Uncharacterized protein n=1 Tax=Vicia faba TaxID=3906 RepID=A0AAV1APH2_VICFA|nr:unnamed protein product [Vicia faba]